MKEDAKSKQSTFVERFGTIKHDVMFTSYTQSLARSVQHDLLGEAWRRKAARSAAPDQGVLTVNAGFVSYVTTQHGSVSKSATRTDFSSVIKVRPVTVTVFYLITMDLLEEKANPILCTTNSPFRNPNEHSNFTIRSLRLTSVHCYINRI
jgi:hypothetical protein